MMYFFLTEIIHQLPPELAQAQSPAVDLFGSSKFVVGAIPPTHMTANLPEEDASNPFDEAPFNPLPVMASKDVFGAPPFKVTYVNMLSLLKGRGKVVNVAIQRVIKRSMGHKGVGV